MKKRYGVSIAHVHVEQLKPKAVKVHPVAPVVDEQEKPKVVRKLIKWEKLDDTKR